MTNEVEQSSGVVSLSPQIHGLIQVGSRSEGRLWVLGSLGNSPLPQSHPISEVVSPLGVSTGTLGALALTMLRLWIGAITAQAKVGLRARWRRLSGWSLVFRDHRT